MTFVGVFSLFFVLFEKKGKHFGILDHLQHTELFTFFPPLTIFLELSLLKNLPTS